MTIQIKHITALGSGNVILLNIEISDGANTQSTPLKILAEQYARLHPMRGIITEFEYETLEKESNVCEAYQRALNILSFGPNTGHTIKVKLRRRGFNEQTAETVVSMLAEKGYIDEEADIEREIEHCIKKLWGSRRIIANLRQKGFDDEAMAHIDDILTSIDFSENCLKLLSQKCLTIPTDPHERQKLVAFLARYGYSMSEIHYAFSNFKSIN